MVALAYLAFAGFIASLVAHIGGYAGVSEPYGLNPWPLHAGAIIIWFPAALVMRKLTIGTAGQASLKIIMRGCPVWVSKTFYVVFAYALASFAFFWITGFFGLVDSDNSGVVRGFSGHWMIFYFAAFAVFLSYARREKDNLVNLCQNGHSLDEADAFCSKCGAPSVRSGNKAS